MNVPEARVCATCGAHYPGGEPAPSTCRICADERQYVPGSGQRWLSLTDLFSSHANRIEEVEPGLIGVGVEPEVGIGQRALLVRTAEGNVLWDCVPVLTDEGHAGLAALGGVTAIAVSHPHFYTGIAHVAERLGAVVYLHEADREHVTHPSPRIRFWSGERKALFGGLTLIRAGGHFAGGTVLHWPAGARGSGALLTSDIITVIPDRSHVSFLYSYPNQIPLPVREVERIGAAVEPFEFSRIHGGWWGRVIETSAKAVVRRSVERYGRAIRGRLDGVELPWPT